MKPILAATAITLAMASPAQAARVTNLDSVAHVVQFEQAGDVVEQTVQPNQTAYFPRQDGVISLKGGMPAKSTVTSDGLLSGIVGASRTSQIPAGPADDFTIWPEGKLMLQRRIKGLNGSN